MEPMEVATYLKIGTTALVLDMIEDGFFARDYALQSPVQAIRDMFHFLQGQDTRFLPLLRRPAYFVIRVEPAR